MSSRGVGAPSPRASARGASPLVTSRNGSRGGGVGGGGGDGGGVQGARHASRHGSSFMKARASVSSRGGVSLEQNNDTRGVSSAGGTKHMPATGSGNPGGRAPGSASARYQGRGGGAGLGGHHDQTSARGGAQLDSSRSQRGGESEGGQDAEHMGGWGGAAGAWQNTNNNPAARHEEARQSIEQETANKLTRVIEMKKIANLKVCCRAFFISFTSNVESYLTIVS